HAEITPDQTLENPWEFVGAPVVGHEDAEHSDSPKRIELRHVFGVCAGQCSVGAFHGFYGRAAARAGAVVACRGYQRTGRIRSMMEQLRHRTTQRGGVVAVLLVPAQ